MKDKVGKTIYINDKVVSANCTDYMIEIGYVSGFHEKLNRVIITPELDLNIEYERPVNEVLIIGRK